jgi:hypothetical protein
MVDAQVVGMSIMFLFLLFTFLGWVLFPGFVFLLFDLVVFVLFILVLLTSLASLVLVSYCGSCRKLGSKLELSPELINAAAMAMILSPSRDLAPHVPTLHK